jgi:Phage Mu protein F like protein
VAVDWEGERQRRGKDMAAVERRLFESFGGLVGSTLERIEPKVLNGGQPDPRGALAAQGWFTREVGDWVDEDLAAVAWAALDDADVQDVIPDSKSLIQDYLDGAKNRLVSVPDRVYAVVKDIVAEGVENGDSNERLAERVARLFGDEGIETWEGRVMTVVRTEALAAQNAGTYASFLSIAAADDTAWEKAWLSTVDGRVRETHKKADQQRVKLKQQFRVGGARLLFPGDPSGPPEEVINCRCSLLLLEPGEEIDTSNRQYEGD